MRENRTIWYLDGVAVSCGVFEDRKNSNSAESQELDSFAMISFGMELTLIHIFITCLFLPTIQDSCPSTLPVSTHLPQECKMQNGTSRLIKGVYPLPSDTVAHPR